MTAAPKAPYTPTGMSTSVIGSHAHPGWLDLAVGSHMQGNGNHRSNSNLFYGGQDGFSDYNKIQYPTHGSHELTSVDPGHIYHRRFEIVYTSGVHDAGQTVTVGTVSWSADTPHDSQIRFQVRCADDLESIEGAHWTGISGGNHIDRSAGRTDAVLAGRFIQYRAVFLSKDGSNYPVLQEVVIELE